MNDQEHKQMRGIVAENGISCDECGAITYDHDHYWETWFVVQLPHRDIEKQKDITFCMPTTVVCSPGCFLACAKEIAELYGIEVSA